MSLLDQLYGYRRIYDGSGLVLPERGGIRFIGLVARDDPATRLTVVSIPTTASTQPTGRRAQDLDGQPERVEFLRADVARLASSYTPLPQEETYPAVPSGLPGTPYARAQDLDALRLSVENLRALTERLLIVLKRETSE